jgi:integrase
MSTPTPKPFVVGRVRVRALAARGQRDGAWYWRAERYAEGASETVWTGWATADEAERTVARIVGGVAPAPAAGTTVRDLLELWIARQEDRRDARQVAPATVKWQVLAAEHLVTHLGHVLVDRIDGRQLERMVAARVAEGGAPLTIRLEIVAIRAAWAWGREAGHVDRELPRIKHRAEAVSDRYTPTRSEVEAVIARLSGWQRAVTELLASTGCRIGEVAQLDAADVDVGASCIRVRGKTGRRTVPLAPPAMRRLECWLGGRATGPLWGRTVLTVRQTLGPALREAAEDAGVRAFTPHGLRRWVRGLLRRSGADASVSASILGHSVAVMQRYYDQIDAEEEHAAMRAARLGYLGDTDERVVELPRTRTGPAQR